jgi:hypothetical protein
MDTDADTERPEGTTLYLYLAMARGRRIDYSAFLYAEDDEQARARAEAWWKETCQIATDLQEQFIGMSIERQTMMRRAGRREYPPVVTIDRNGSKGVQS